MKKKKVITICGIIFVVVVLVVCFAIVQLSKKELKEAEKDLEQTTQKYGYVEKEKINVTVAKFNTEIMDNGLEYPANEDYLVVEDNTYWYALYDDILLFVEAENFTNDKEKDIAETMGICYDKNSENTEMAQEYVKYLIKANNNNLTDDEIDYLIKEAQRLSESKEMANNGKGISVGFVEAEDHCEYQVRRLYK